jgi:hypothetical protein
VSDHVPLGEVQLAEGVHRLSSPLGGRSGIEQELAILANFIDRGVAVTEYDHVRIRKTTMQSGRPTRDAPAVVDHSDLHTGDLDCSSKGKSTNEGDVVVAEYGVDWRNAA